MNRMRSKRAMACALVLLFSIGHVALSAPSNDDCANAKAVGNVTDLPFDTTKATFDGPGHYLTGPNIWYCYTASCTGCATVSLMGSSYDTKMAIYTGCDCYPSSNKLIVCNDDYMENSPQSQATFAVTAGEQYLIEVGGFNDSVKGEGVITISCDSGARPPSNDDCINATSIGFVTNLLFDTHCATFDGPGHCVSSPNLWYLFRPTQTGDVTISLVRVDDIDTKLAVYMGSNCYPRYSDMIECNDDYGNSLDSQLTFTANADEYYLIEVGGDDEDAVGKAVMNITHDYISSSDNDDCSEAQAVSEVTNLEFDTTETSFDGPGLCLTSPNIWFLYTASYTGDVTVSLLGSSYDTMLAVYTGDDCDLTSGDLIECNDDISGVYQSKITFSATAGAKYLIEIGGYGSNTGEGILNISCESEAQSTKDNCENAQTIGEVKDRAFDTTEASFDGPGLCLTSPNIWYLYTPSCTGEAMVSLLGSGFDTMLAVYRGDDCDLTSDDVIECNDDISGVYQSEITFDATAGAHYLIEIGGYGSNTGEGILNISCESTTQPSKDNCENAQTIGEVKDLAFDTTEASFDGPGLCLTSPNIWFLYTPSHTGNATVSLLGSSYDTILAVYMGDDCDLTSNDLIECNDDTSGVYQSEITFAAVADETYLIEIGGYGSNTGQGILNISCEPAAVENAPDLGDAPDSTNNSDKNMTAYSGVKANFPTVYNDGSDTGPFGPVHLNDQVVAYLGKSITAETEADKGADDDGLNNIDPSFESNNNDKGDDGVLTPLNLPTCQWTTFEYTVNVIDPNVDLYVNVWFDWNRDGDWDDTLECAQGLSKEWAVQNQLLFDLPVGINTITSLAFLPWHPTSPEEVWMRITLSEQSWRHGSNPDEKGNAGSGPEDKYLFGETEDYYFIPDLSFVICQDFNGDGEINTDDLVDFTADWLENCPD